MRRKSQPLNIFSHPPVGPVQHKTLPRDDSRKLITLTVAQADIYHCMKLIEAIDGKGGIRRETVATLGPLLRSVMRGWLTAK